jgi:hypothetical protein
MIPEHIVKEIEDLRKEGHSIDLIESEGWANAILGNLPVPAGYNKTLTSLLIKLPMSYPNGRPDMFWTDEDLILKDGRVPRNADVIEIALEKKWRRFSWHPQSWNPGTDNLHTYLEFVNSGLVKARNLP